MRKALQKIAGYGRVCGEFETCRHATCEDSAGAALAAMEVLGSFDKRADERWEVDSPSDPTKHGWSLGESGGNHIQHFRNGGQGRLW